MITKAVFLVILGLHPVDNKVLPQVAGPFATVEACQAEAENFKVLALEAGLVKENFNLVCFVSKWDLKTEQETPEADEKPAEDVNPEIRQWEGDL